MTTAARPTICDRSAVRAQQGDGDATCCARQIPPPQKKTPSPLSAPKLPLRRLRCVGAAKGGHLAVLQWLRAQEPPCPWDRWTCTAAALGGHLHVLQWARANGCPWNEDPCTAAAKHGHLELLQWARAQGCPG
jgi:hypothetical protein